MQDWVLGFIRACVMQGIETPVQPQDLLAEVDDDALHDMWHVVCESDTNLPFVQRLVKLAGPRLNISSGFRSACEAGALAVAQWLFVLSPEALVDVLNDTFACVCLVGDLPTAQWLASLDAVEVHHNHDSPFRKACWCFARDGHAVAQWLVGLGGVDIHGQGDQAANIMVHCGNWTLARWLLALDPAWPKWPPRFLTGMRTWSAARDAWMRAATQAATTQPAPAPLPLP
jgi:hypothetical protein